MTYSMTALRLTAFGFNARFTSTARAVFRACGTRTNVIKANVVCKKFLGVRSL
jgi:hypothetical protein